MIYKMPKPKINELGHIYGYLTVIGEAKDKNGRSAWLCQCKCGKQKVVRGSDLRSNRITSCGCRGHLAEKERKDITGQIFGKLTAISYAYSKNGKTYWKFQCECGNITIKSRASVENGYTLSCGCSSKLFNSQANTINEIPGTMYGFLEVIKPATPFIRNRHAFWTCKCHHCGSIADYNGTMLRNGNTKSCGCVLSMKEEEIAIMLSRHNILYKRQFTFPDLKGDSRPLRFDFAIFDNKKNLLFLIEYQGEQHYRESSWDKTYQDFIKRQIYDQKKINYCRSKNIPLLILNKDSNLEKDILQKYEV